MNKLQLIDKVSSEMNLTKREAEKVVAVIFGTIKDQLKKNESVNIGGFGEFKVNTRKARKGINPKTGEKINIAAVNAPKFRPSKAFKEMLN